MKERFEGDSGRRRLCEALRDHLALCGNATLIARVAAAAELLELQKGDELFQQGAADCDVYFVLLGAGFEILIDGVPVAARNAGEVLGEMAAIEPSALRSATARAFDTTVVAKLPEAIFDEICRTHPEAVLRGVCRTLANRLRERSKFIRPRAARPKLFIGSSAENIRIAEAIQRGMNHAPLDTIIWTNSVFKAGSTAIEDLTRALSEFDFAAFVLNTNDTLVIRGETLPATRDNVTFELGLFIGSLGRDRAVGIVPRGAEMRRPTDLFGVTFIDYDSAASSLDVAVSVVCTQLKELVRDKGPR